MSKIKPLNRIIVLALAFVMILGSFTGGFGSLGVELAMAETSAETSVIKTSEAFAAMEPGGSYELGADITITAPYTAPYKDEFSGTFDGKGHTVTLAIGGSKSNVGLFSKLGSTAVVKNVHTSGSVSGTECVGGIAGINAGKIISCKNTATISATGRYVGGIAGKTTGTIQDCYNTGAISSTRETKGVYLGGITGYLDGGSLISCFNTREISVIASTTNYGAISGWVYNGKVEQCYYLGTESTPGANTSGSTNLAQYKREDEMKSSEFAALLGEGFRAKAGDYPALAWEVPTAAVPFSIMPSNAVLTIRDESSNVVYEGTGRTISLPAGSYTYTVTCEGYTPETDSFTVSKEEANNSDTLGEQKITLSVDEELWGTVSFNVTGSDNYHITVRNGNALIAPIDENSSSYKLLKSKEYNYCVSSGDEAVESETGTITVTETNTVKEISLKTVSGISIKTAASKTEYYVGDVLDTTGLTLTVKYSDSTTADITEGFEVTGFNSTVAEDSQVITVKYKGSSASYNIKVSEKPFPSTVFNNLAGKAEVSYKSSNESKVASKNAFVDGNKLEVDCLKSNSAGQNSTEVSVEIKFTGLEKANRLTFDYILSSENNGSSRWDYLKINNEEILSVNDKSWNSYSIIVNNGDTVRISYIKDSSTAKLDDCIYLKDFNLAELRTLTIQPKDAEGKNIPGADIVLKDSEDQIVSGNYGVYTVEDGTYSYTINAFGYETAAGTVIVNGGDKEEQKTLTKLASKKVSFHVTVPEGLESSDVSIEVKNGSETVSAEADGTYQLPAGEYTYTITHPNCETVTSQFNVAGEDVEITKGLIRKWVISDYFSGMNVTATNGENYGFILDQEDKTVLASNNQSKSNSTAQLTLTAGKSGKMSFMYKVGSEKNYDKFTVAVNGETKVTESGEVNWQDFSINLAAGETVVFKYTKDSSGDKNGDTVWLKQFTFAPLYRLTFSGAPDGTDFVVKHGETEIAAESDGSYLLEIGTYTYAASAFGYETGTGTVEITSADVVHPVSLAAKTGYDVSFNITRPDSIAAEEAIEVKYGDKVIPASEAGKYTLPAGEYTYTVTCEGCETETGTFIVENTEKTVNVGLIKKLRFEDFFTQITEKATVTNQMGAYSYNPVKNGDEKYLQSSNKANGSKSTITFEFQKPSVLSFEYMVSEEGSTSTSSDYGLIIKRNNTQIASFEEVSDAWKTYQISADAGDKVTLVYSCYKNDYSMTQSDENWLRLKNFDAAPLTKVIFDGMPENAVITVKKNTEAITPVDRKYLLSEGTYEYEVKAFGYETISARSFTLDGTKESMTETVTMTPTQRVNVTFAITEPASGAVVVVKNSTGEIMAPTAENSMIYSLPKDEEYSCEISAEGYISAEKHFRADAGKTITVALVSAGVAWDGTTKSEPVQENGVYQIANGDELAWFAEQVSSTPSINGKLIANINLGGKTWSGFGEYNYNDDASGFAGTLDGGGYTISGLSGSSGLVNCLAPGGTIKNLTAAGEISGSGVIGGIANTSKGTIENCVFKGSIINSGNSGTGGIAGRATTGNKIKGCISTATVKNSYAYYNSELKTGGIAGYTYGTIENCYFTGEVQADASKTSNKAIGGIAGTVYAAGTIKNSYTIGSVTGPEAGIGAVAGINSGAITNVYYLEGITANAVASNSASSAIDVSQKTSGEMKEGLFAYTLGDAFNQDDAADSINSGYPVLKWQGGTEPSVPQFEQDVISDMNAIVLKDAGKAASIEASKKQVRDDLARDGMFAKEWETIGGLTEDEKEAKLMAGYDEYLQYQLALMGKTIDETYEIMGIDQSDDGTLQENSEGIYEFRNEITITFPNQGEKGSSISWSSSNEDVIDPLTGKVTLLASETAAITLTASVTKGNISKTKEFKCIVYSDSSQDQQLLEEIKAKAEQTSNFIQPLQMYNHTNMREVMEQWLSKRGYKTQAIDGSGITVEFVSAGTKAMPNDNKTYIDDDGSITYFTGSEYGYGTKYALYNDVKFRLTFNEAATEVSVRVHIGWDAEYVQNLLDEAMNKITWDSIKGSNTNTSKDEFSDGWNRTVVEGDVTGELTLPYNLTNSKITYANIKWTATDMDALYVSDNGDGTYAATLVRPAKGEEANNFTLKGIATFEFWDDYTIEQTTTMNGKIELAESFKLFDITVPANTEDQSAGINTALEKYPELIRDFVNKTQTVEMSNVKDDLQMPRPAVLENNGILTDRYYQKVVMTSGNTDLLEFNGYHAYVYRPLPGEDPAEVEYTIQILDRRNNALLGEKTFKMTIKPLEQSELDAAAGWMNKICTEEVFWNGIKGENTSKDYVTSEMNPFEEILDNNGEIEYVRGAINLTFGGAEVDDLPGYDPMYSQPWRQLRSSKPSVVACETLQFEQPEYNTEVMLDSVLTHSSLGKYWTKFGTDPRYKDFEQFYKRPIAVTITLAGKTGTDDPDPQPTTMSVTVSVDGKGSKGFKNIGSYRVDGLNPDTATAWDAVRTALTSSGYSFSGMGDYVASITDPDGVTLTDTDTPNSGWLYTVNGELPDVYMGSYYLKAGDKILLYYTSDYKEDPLAGTMIPSDEEEVITVKDTSGVAITTTPAEITVSGSTATATVKSENAAEAIKQAKENKSAEIVLNVAAADTKGAETVKVQLDTATVKSVVSDTDAALTVKTENGQVSLDREALTAIASEAKGTTITLEVVKVAKPTETQQKAAGTNGQVLQLIVKSGDKIISDFNKGKATVTVEISDGLKDKKVAAIYIAEDDKIEQLSGKTVKIDGKKYYTFGTPHFSVFALVDAEELGLEVNDEEQAKMEKLIAGVENTTLKASSKKAASGIKITWTKSKGYRMDYYEVFRSTKRYSGFGKVAFYTTKNAKNPSKTYYVNTGKLKEGTRYYYKVRGVRILDGKKYYTQWSTKVWRVA